MALQNKDDTSFEKAGFPFEWCLRKCDCREIKGHHCHGFIWHGKIAERIT
jgi:hypothetical protein